MYNVLVAEKGKDVCRAVRDCIEKEGHTVYETENGKTALDMGSKNKYDIIILGTDFDDSDGISVCSEIRNMRSTPIMFVSEKDSVEKKLSAFKAGADDFLAFPFYPEELIARIYAIIYRYGGQRFTLHSERYESEGLIIDMLKRRVFVDGTVSDMSPKEYDLLFYLVKNRGKAIKREELLTEIWGFDFFGDERTLDTHIKLIRHSLGRYSGKIVTLRGMGYKFEDGKI